MFRWITVSSRNGSSDTSRAEHIFFTLMFWHGHMPRAHLQKIRLLIFWFARNRGSDVFQTCTDRMTPGCITVPSRQVTTCTWWDVDNSYTVMTRVVIGSGLICKKSDFWFLDLQETRVSLFCNYARVTWFPRVVKIPFRHISTDLLRDENPSNTVTSLHDYMLRLFGQAFVST